ncbi:MAG: hydrogenase subunit MbhD domain-containing protein [Desulfurococcaceae archaeon]
MVAETIVYLIMATASLVSTIATYRAIKERDLLRAVIYSALQSGLYTILYYFLMAPDIVLVYLPVAVGLVPGVLIIIVSRTERWEKQ